MKSQEVSLVCVLCLTLMMAMAMDTVSGVSLGAAGGDTDYEATAALVRSIANELRSADKRAGN